MEIYILFLCGVYIYMSLLSLWYFIIYIHRKCYSVDLSYRKICSNVCMIFTYRYKVSGIQLSSSFITNVLTVIPVRCRTRLCS